MTSEAAIRWEKELTAARKMGEMTARRDEMIQILKELMASTKTLIAAYREVKDPAGHNLKYCDLLEERLEWYERRIHELEV